MYANISNLGEEVPDPRMRASTCSTNEFFDWNKSKIKAIYIFHNFFVIQNITIDPLFKFDCECIVLLQIESFSLSAWIWFFQAKENHPKNNFVFRMNKKYLGEKLDKKTHTIKCLVPWTRENWKRCMLMLTSQSC